MKIEFTETVASGSARSWVLLNHGDSFSCGMSKTSQTEEYIPLRSEAAKRLDRKGATQVFEFTITRVHSSISVAESFFMTHPSELAKQGTVTFTTSGDVRTKLTMPDAFVEIVGRGGISGCATTFCYEIKGPSIS